MSDVRSVLTEALAHTLRIHPYGSDLPYGFGEYANRIAPELADILLALPGVVVTQLPKPDEEVPATEFENGSKWFGTGGDVVVYDDGEIHLFGAVWPTEDVRDLAAGLLAAAVLSEGEDTHA